MIGNALQAFFCVLDEVAAAGEKSRAFSRPGRNWFPAAERAGGSKDVQSSAPSGNRGLLPYDVAPWWRRCKSSYRWRQFAAGDQHPRTRRPVPWRYQSPLASEAGQCTALRGQREDCSREGRILTEQHAPALFVGHTKDVILAALCRFQQQPQIQSALFQALSDVIRSRAVKVELDQRVVSAERSASAEIACAYCGFLHCQWRFGQ